MKKLRIALLVTLVFMMVLGTGCAEREDPVAPSAATAAAQTHDTGPAPGSKLTADDLVIVRGGVSYPLMRDAAPLTGVLGEPDAYSEAPSCVYEGMDKSFEYDDIGIYTNPEGGKDIAYEFIVYGEGYATPRGIETGAAREAVVAAYGEGHEDGRYLNYYITSKDDMKSPRLCFDMGEDGVVLSIDIYYPTNITEE